MIVSIEPNIEEVTKTAETHRENLLSLINSEGRVTRKELVPICADLILLRERYGVDVNMRPVTAAIIERWSFSGLEWILKESWKRAEAIG